MTSTTKRGFHLPWSGESRGPIEAADASDQTDERKPAADRGAPKEAATAVSNPQMSWPDVDRAGSSTHSASDSTLPPVRPAVVVDGTDGTTPASPRGSRRDNPLVVGLVRAMRDAARATREETAARMRAEATARMDEIRAGSAAEAIELRKRADDDAIGIREWSKAEIARIRDEAEKRVAERRAQLTRQTEAHATEIERLVEQVQDVATTFEAEMDQFFEVLLAEEDPARLATLAEQVPDAPMFSDLPSLKRLPAARATGANGAAKPKAPAGRAAGPRAATSEADATEARLEPDAAAAAEAEAIADLDPVSTEAEDLSPEEMVGLLGIDTGSPDDLAAADRLADGDWQTRVVVTGLTSVAGISTFKGALGRVAGVTTVSVSTGADDDFVFDVAHTTTTDLRRAVAAFAGFDAHMTLDDGDVISFTVAGPN